MRSEKSLECSAERVLARSEPRVVANSCPPTPHWPESHQRQELLRRVLFPQGYRDGISSQGPTISAFAAVICDGNSKPERKGTVTEQVPAHADIAVGVPFDARTGPARVTCIEPPEQVDAIFVITTDDTWPFVFFPNEYDHDGATSHTATLSDPAASD